MLLKYDIFADWFDLIYVDHDEKDADEFDDGEEREQNTQIETLALRVASDVGFHRARTRDQRLYVTKRVLKGEADLDSQMLKLIARQAKAIYEIDIKPEYEKKLVENIRKLRAEGMQPKDIAQEVGLPVQKVKFLLG